MRPCFASLVVVSFGTGERRLWSALSLVLSLVALVGAFQRSEQIGTAVRAAHRSSSVRFRQQQTYWNTLSNGPWSNAAARPHVDSPTRNTQSVPSSTPAAPFLTRADVLAHCRLSCMPKIPATTSVTLPARSYRRKLQSNTCPSPGRASHPHSAPLRVGNWAHSHDRRMPAHAHADCPALHRSSGKTPDAPMPVQVERSYSERRTTAHAKRAPEHCARVGVRSPECGTPVACLKVSCCYRRQGNFAYAFGVNPRNSALETFQRDPTSLAACVRLQRPKHCTSCRVASSRVACAFVCTFRREPACQAHIARCDEL